MRVLVTQFCGVIILLCPLGVLVVDERVTPPDGLVGVGELLVPTADDGVSPLMVRHDDELTVMVFSSREKYEVFRKLANWDGLVGGVLHFSGAERVGLAISVLRKMGDLQLELECRRVLNIALDPWWNEDGSVGWLALGIQV